MSSDRDVAPARGQPVLAAIALGANLGDRARTIGEAAARVARLPSTSIRATSALYDTAPVGPPDQPRYLNAAMLVETRLGAGELMQSLLAIECELGRIRSESRWTARAIDLDLVLYGEAMLSEVREAGHARVAVEVPHPRFRERAFVLVPLAEIAGSMCDPVTGERVESLLLSCPGREDVRHAGAFRVPGVVDAQCTREPSQEIP